MAVDFFKNALYPRGNPTRETYTKDSINGDRLGSIVFVSDKVFKALSGFALDGLEVFVVGL